MVWNNFFKKIVVFTLLFTLSGKSSFAMFPHYYVKDELATACFCASYLSFLWFIQNSLRTHTTLAAYQIAQDKPFLAMAQNHQLWTRLSLLTAIGFFGGSCYFTYRYFKNLWNGKYSSIKPEEITCNSK